MNTKIRIWAMMCVTVLIFSVLGMRLFYIQIVQHQYFARRARGHYTFVEQNIIPPRGEVFDRKGEVMALNRHTYSVGVNPAHINSTEEILPILARTLGKTESKIRTRLTGAGGFRWLKRHAEPEHVRELHKYSTRGIVLVRENHRIYPNAPVASDVVGTVGTDNQGLSGIEHSLEGYLRGKPLKRKMIKDARGRTIYLDPGESDNCNGNSKIHLTIDSGLQYIAEREIKSGLSRYGAQRAMAIIQEPNTGRILAMATYPKHDHSQGMPEDTDMLKIMPVTNIFEPGSTFKIFTAAAALEEGVVEVNEQFNCEGGTYTVGGFPIRDFEAHDFLSFREVIMYSSNIGTAKAAERLGENLLYKYARDFGFGNFTGIKLPGEPRGILRKPDRWSGTSLSRISFGQEVGVTALQLASAISAVACGGVLYQPQIVKSINRGGRVREYEPLPIRRVISERTAAKVSSILQDAVKEGSGKNAALNGYAVAGKTGTAQKFDPQTFTYAQDRYIALFGGYIPADEPRLTILVVFEEPEGPFHWGGYVAAPVFASIARASLNYLNIPPAAAKEMVRK